jgi:spermidine synthase
VNPRVQRTAATNALWSARRRWLTAAFCVGFSSLVYEVYSAKVLFLFFVETTHAVSITLSAFLAGLAFSSLYFSRRVRPGDGGEGLIIGMQIAAAIYAYAVLRNYELIPILVDRATLAFGQTAAVATRFAVAWVFLFFPGFFVGGAFPILNGLLLSSREAGARDTGTVYFWDTLGAILGALAAGFVLLPVLGLKTAIVVPVAVNLCVIGLVARRQGLALAAPALGVALLAIELLRPRDEPPVAVRSVAPLASSVRPTLEERFGRVLFQRESPYGRVTVGEHAHTIKDNRALFINYRDMCHSKLAASEKLLAEIALSQLPPGSRVLNIGLGCGFTAGRIAASDKVTSLEIAEINPVVVEATRRFFGPDNQRVLERSKTQVVVQDGAELLRQTAQRYHAIVVDIEEPTILYSSPLYTREYFEIMKARLAPGGLVAIWCIGSDPVYGKILHNTLRSVFPFVRPRIESMHLLFFASTRALDVPVASVDEQRGIEALLSVESDAINTIDNRVLERHFDIRRAFALPKEYDERYFSDHAARPVEAPDAGGHP